MALGRVKTTGTHVYYYAGRCAYTAQVCVITGELVAHCEGPTKSAQCQLIDNHDGTYTLDVIAAEAGRHVLSIEHDGQHTAGRHAAFTFLSVEYKKSRRFVYGFIDD